MCFQRSALAISQLVGMCSTDCSILIATVLTWASPYGLQELLVSVDGHRRSSDLWMLCRALKALLSFAKAFFSARDTAALVNPSSLAISSWVKSVCGPLIFLTSSFIVIIYPHTRRSIVCTIPGSLPDDPIIVQNLLGMRPWVYVFHSPLVELLLHAVISI